MARRTTSREHYPSSLVRLPNPQPDAEVMQRTYNDVHPSAKRPLPTAEDMANIRIRFYLKVSVSVIAWLRHLTSSSVRYRPRNHRVVVERTYRGLLATQRDRGLDLHSSVSGDIAGGRCDAGQDHRDSQIRNGIGGADADEKFADEASGGHGGEKTDR